MVFSGAIEIVRARSGELKLVFHPSHAGALLLFGLTIVFIVLAIALNDKRSGKITMLLGAVICILLRWIAGLIAVSQFYPSQARR